MTPTLVFDIETIPDIAGLRRIHALPATLADSDVLAWALQQRRAATGGDFNISRRFPMAPRKSANGTIVLLIKKLKGRNHG